MSAFTRREDRALRISFLKPGRLVPQVCSRQSLLTASLNGMSCLTLFFTSAWLCLVCSTLGITTAQKVSGATAFCPSRGG